MGMGDDLRRSAAFARRRPDDEDTRIAHGVRAFAENAEMVNDFIIGGNI